MIVGYIKQENNPVNLLDKLKYYLGFIKIEQIGQSYVIGIPIKQNELIYIKEYMKYFNEKKKERKIKKLERKLKRITQNIIKYIEKYQINILVFSNVLSCYERISNVNCFEMYLKEQLKARGYIKEESNIYHKDITFLNGKILMQYMQYEILKYILQIQNKNVSQEDIYFLIKKDSKLDLDFLNSFIENAKTVNIVTNDIERFKNIQEKLYEKENILIGVSNNKNKALKRAKYIFNINLNQKEIEKFKINREAILIHIKEYVKHCKNSFEGININKIELHIPDEYIEEFEQINNEECQEFELLKMYEVMLLQRIYQRKQNDLIFPENNVYKMNYQIAKDIIKNDEVKIIGLIGNNGKIEATEFLKLEKVYEN